MYSFTKDGKPGPDLMHQGSLQEPSPEIKELAMGYKKGTTAAGGRMSSLRHKLLGACLDHNISVWLLKACRDHQAADSAHHGSASPKSEAQWFPLGFLDDWIYDTGATAHFTCHRSDYLAYEDISPRLVHGMNLYAIGTGKVKISVLVRTSHMAQPSECIITLHNVLYVPDLIKNGAKVTRLLSQRAAHILDNGTKPVFISSAESSIIHFGSHFVQLDIEANKNLLTMQSKIVRDDQPSEVAMTASVSRTPKALPAPLWHKRLGHISANRLTRMQKLQLGINIKAVPSPAPCEACAITKSTRLPNGNGNTSRDFEPFEKVGCDIWSHSTPSLRGFHHLLGFTCYNIGFLNVYLMKTKDQSPEVLEQYLKWIIGQNRTVRFMRCDSDPVFKGEEFDEVAKSFHVDLNYSAPYTPT